MKVLNVKKTQIALDSQCYTYLATTMEYLKEPFDSLKAEKVSLFRSFVYGEVDFQQTPTVEEEWQKINDPIKWEIHKKFEVLIPIIHPHNEIIKDRIRSKSKEFHQYHIGLNDCKILAEAEEIGFDYLVTFDNDLINRLATKSKVTIIKPQDFWSMLNVRRGSQTVINPTQKNPMSKKNWWCW